MRDRTKVIPYEKENRHIYAYSLPQITTHEGCIKVGETSRDVEKRIKEQLGTAGLVPNIHFKKLAQYSNGEWFHDKDLHKYFILNNIEKKDFGTGADEWFYFNGTPEKAEELTDKFISIDYNDVQVSRKKSNYKLRKEQQEAVNKTLEYYNDNENEREFLWNAKPRFGKTLATYDFIKKISAKQILIVTNRPAIANSWYDDFEKFISWQEPKMKFSSDSNSLKGKALSREEFLKALVNSEDENLECIYFISLQDLKGGEVFGGSYDKYKWISKLEWDVLIIDEAHEGVDTHKTDKAFSKIKRKFTLHLSGTPFKAIANQKFNEEQIFNWSYIDEQKSKEEWDVLIGTNPYSNLPTLNMFTYQMSKLIKKKVELGYNFEESNVDYAFDLGEFFKVENEKFKYEQDVINFLDNLASNKFPFAIDEHRNKLNHTLWLLDRVSSAKALEKILRKHPVFKHYKVVLAAGNGKKIDEELNDDKGQEKSLDRVRKAISKSERTITLSVGQLTTGVTIPEWTGVLMLTNIKSPALYFQAAFRAQNPYEYVDSEGRLMRKENAYVFDFAPERTLILYDEFANNLMAKAVKGTSGERKENIRELLNFFPVIAEDENGTLQEINAEEVLTIPIKLKSQEVVKRGFMSNLLFANISAIFAAPSELREILEKISPEKQGKLADKREIPDNKPMLDDAGEVSIPREIVINEAKNLFGEKIYSLPKEIDIDLDFDSVINNDTKAEVKAITSSIMEDLKEGIDGLKDKYSLTVKQEKRLSNNFNEQLENRVEKIIEEKNEIIKEINAEYEAKLKNVTTEDEKIKVGLELAVEIKLAEEKVRSSIADEIEEVISETVEEQIEKVEEEKKKSTEDEVRDHLRGFARTIPAFLMAYGDKNTTLANFEQNIDKDTFLDLTSITIDEFKKLRDGFTYVDEETGEERIIPGLFDEVVFNSSVAEFFDIKARLADYFTNDSEEDIFDYIPPQKTNQIFTPRRVVNMMLDSLEENVPDIFEDKNKKFVDLYIKSGLYLTEIAKRLFKGLEKQIPFEEERIKHIFEKQLYGFAPSNIIYNISKNFVFGEFDSIRKKNIVECDLVPVVETGKLEEKIKEVWGEDMKFDVVIGNPPYQEMDNTSGTGSAKPLYHFFIYDAIRLSPEYISLIIPSVWFNGGKGLNNFRMHMLNEKSLRKIINFKTPQDVFENVNLRGGVNYFIWEKQYDNKNEIYVENYAYNKRIDKGRRVLKIENLDILIIDKCGAEIISRFVQEDIINESKSLMNLVSARNPFGFSTTFVKSDDYNIQASNLKKPVKIYTSKSKFGFVEYDKIQKFNEFIDAWKVITPFANNIGTDLPDDNLNAFISEPGTISTETYLVISDGLKSTKERCNNIIKYLKTKFVRFLISLAKANQNGTRITYRFVPLQDFTSNSDIDWTKSIEEIDEQLFEKYGLSEEEREHIKNSIKEM